MGSSYGFCLCDAHTLQENLSGMGEILPFVFQGMQVGDAERVMHCAHSKISPLPGVSYAHYAQAFAISSQVSCDTRTSFRHVLDHTNRNRVPSTKLRLPTWKCRTAPPKTCKFMEDTTLTNHSQKSSSASISRAFFKNFL